MSIDRPSQFIFSEHKRQERWRPCVCVWGGGGGVRWGGRRGRAETLARFSFDTHCVSGAVNIFFY